MASLSRVGWRPYCAAAAWEWRNKYVKDSLLLDVIKYSLLAKRSSLT
jgi:hypothetical protein